MMQVHAYDRDGIVFYGGASIKLITHRMNPLKELVLRKIVHMQTVSRLPHPRFRLDSIALALNLPVESVIDCVDELSKENIVTYFQPEKVNKNHPVSNIGEVSLYIPIYEANNILRLKSKPIP